jgi:hypothetical protein
LKKISLVVATLLSSQSLTADEVVNDWSMSGNLRAAYISDDGDNMDQIHDMAVGGWITLTTPSVKGFSAFSTVYTSQPLMNMNTDTWLFDSDGTSFTYVGEAYVTGTVFGKTSVTIGKKVIDTPFADSDDMGMSPNSFEINLVQNNDIENITLLGGRVTAQAGMDAPTRGKFTDLTDGDGASVLAGIYGNDDLGISGQAWYYHLDNVAKTIDKSTGVNIDTDAEFVYIDADLQTVIAKDVSVSLSGQFANFKHINGDEKDGSVIGANIELGYDVLTLGVGFNKANGDITAQNGFGGGPYYTSSDILTLNSAGADSKAMRFSTSYSINNQVSVGGGYLIMTPKKGKDLTEIDLSISYAYNDYLSFDLYAEQWKDYKSNDDSISYNETLDYSEYRLFMNYKF